MASPVGRPLAASQGLAWHSGDVFCPISVATYNVGASQEVAFQSIGKLEPFKRKLQEDCAVLKSNVDVVC